MASCKRIPEIGPVYQSSQSRSNYEQTFTGIVLCTLVCTQLFHISYVLYLTLLDIQRNKFIWEQPLTKCAEMFVFNSYSEPEIASSNCNVLHNLYNFCFYLRGLNMMGRERGLMKYYPHSDFVFELAYIGCTNFCSKCTITFPLFLPLPL